MTESAKKDFRIGFLTAIEVAGGYVGGLLITNHQGRPLEFQCTAPVRPNRMQEILYGPTLQPFLLGELIGQALVEKVNVKPHLVLAEQPTLLDLRNHIEVPVACVEATKETSGESAASEDAAPRATLGRQRLRFHAAHADDRAVVDKCGALVPRDADILEPFERVREALAEAVNAPALK